MKGESTMIDIYGIYKKIPGGSLLVPMFLVAILNTIFPDLLTSFGGMTTAMFKGGTLAFAGAILFFTGATIKVNTLGTVFKRCGVLTIMKFAIAFGFGFAFVKLFGAEGFAGITAVAFVTCMCSCNPGVFMGLATDYGETEDMGNFAMMNLVSMPCWPLLILATAAGLKFNIMDMITVLVPFLLGMLLGNLDPGFSKVVAPAINALIPLMGCCFGASLNLITAAKAGLAGILLSILYLIINVPLMLFADKVITKRPGYAAVAWCSVAGIAMTVPAMLEGMEEYVPTLPAAGAQIGLCMIITCIVSPFITRWVVDKWGSPKVPSKAERARIAAEGGAEN